jgi:ketosteroid isomerase-like protein
MKSAADLVQEYLRYMTTDLTKWRALFNENAIWEFAFAPSAGVPGVARGIMEIAQRVEGFVARVEELIFDDLKIYQIAGADAVFAEFQGRAKVISTGRQYQQNYVVYLCAEDGKIIFAREYFDPARVVAAFS